ncbi:MAG: protocatechuate 3,4-dioxygenase subunit alpha [Candidatus Dormibacteraeota bacterium]|uniref:Protocatechuate 3,4-dioxygenase subunit alpha n=1 Tax=Candidatus Dormiibacter inghamiae TaxID=3127013 RepID=A0A934NAZ9_9BACT|nr:protocatechuate 3,4-dioxygenase subunit alpha [Candidatus Dormibacteraeota bacterium]MBJ7606982.1 protocatechuate 3,4-dioxygenase subunit alpha [Candidatus Dormibacteraeota bacterium]
MARTAPTPSQTVGPFFGFALPFAGGSDAIPSGQRELRIEGQVLDGAGAPIPDALLELWQGEQFARCATDVEGAFHFTASKPAPMPGPDGTVQAPHFSLTVFARGLLRQLQTRIYFPDETAANSADWVLARVEPERRPTLVARAEPGALRFDVRLQGEGETVFFAL